MDYYKYLILVKNEINDDITNCYYDKVLHKYVITYKQSPQTYSYSYNNVKYISLNQELNYNDYTFSLKNGQTLFNINRVLEFKNGTEEFYRFFFNNKTFKTYNAQDLIIKNSSSSRSVKGLIGYYSKIADIVGIKANDNTNILATKFKKLKFESYDTVLASYLHPEISLNKIDNDPVIFPFGCNLSQITAVRNALTSKVSIIEGPPGTGKTQTILNIIANIVLRGETVAVLSNNNSATDNVFEKLQKYNYDYIAAQLGNSTNKEEYIRNKQQQYPEFSKPLSGPAKNKYLNEIKSSEKKLIELFKTQNKLSELKKNLSAITLEQKYFNDYFKTSYTEENIFKPKAKLSSSKLLRLWQKLEYFLEKEKRVSFLYKLKTVISYGFNGFDVYKNPIDDIIAQLKRLFYILKIKETKTEINNCESLLSRHKVSELIDKLNSYSNTIFKDGLSKKYRRHSTRPIFELDDLWKNSEDFLKEYPVILSTTFSAKNSLKNVTYDYIIVDESSQVDLATGVLAMSCANNIVVVGDTMQLPNIIPNNVKGLIAKISDDCNIASNYRYEENSLLSSVLSTFANAPKVLLREHYRCHPKIIEFCNQKFYNNQLIIMTEDHNEDDVLKVYVTTSGSHQRQHSNQRQIDEIKYHILPELNSNDVGIIAPYCEQTSKLSLEFNDCFDISTVHKFQGREKDDIIVTTVDDEISEFTDNPNMLNVAVSRAKKRLRLVVSEASENSRTNIGDLIRYIKYNNFEVKHSEIHSVFDMLYKCYEENRKKYLKGKKRISQYDSENIMYTLIKEILNCDRFSKFDVIAHQPLRAIISNFNKLDEQEKRYAMNPLTHVDFLIFDTIDKSPILAVEVDGYAYHKDNSKQSERDKRKDVIFEKYNIPLIRFSTTGSMEKERLIQKLIELV